MAAQIHVIRTPEPDEDLEKSAMLEAFGRMEGRLDEFSTRLADVGKEHAGAIARLTVIVEELSRRIGILNGTVPEHTLQIAQKASREDVNALKGSIEALAAEFRAQKDREAGAAEVKAKWHEHIVKPLVHPLVAWAFIFIVGAVANSVCRDVINAVTVRVHATQSTVTTTTDSTTKVTK